MPPLLKLCQKFAVEHDEAAGRQAVAYLNNFESFTSEVALECMDLAWKVRIFGQDIADGLLAGLLRQSLAARIELANRLWNGTTVCIFTEVLEFGDASSKAMCTVVLDAAAWRSESVRLEMEKDILQLYLAKLLEIGDSSNEVAMRGIARLLAAGSEQLSQCQFIDDICFNSILSALDYRYSAEYRTQATLVVAKLLEATDSTKNQDKLTKFVITHIAKGENKDLVLAFSAAAAVFPVARSIAVQQFLRGGFVSSLVPLLEAKANAEGVERAALEMLSAACIDTACRDEIRKHCLGWIKSILNRKIERETALAAVVLAKLPGPSATGQKKEVIDVDDLLPYFKHMTVDEHIQNRQTSIEGLAFLSVHPQVKQQIVRDGDFLAGMLRNLRNLKSDSPTIYGGLILIDHLTKFLPHFSEEEKKMAELKAYANASSHPSKPDAFDEDAAVIERGKIMLDAGTIPLLVHLSSQQSQPGIAVLFDILLSLSRPQGAATRGTIAQQGGVKVILTNYPLLTDSGVEIEKARRAGAQALSRILIHVDPTLVFPASGNQSMLSAIRPISTLLTDDPYAKGPRDNLPRFEALMALTNIALSAGAAEAIIRLCFSTIEDLLTSSNIRVQNAAIQLILNLVRTASGVELFADGSAPAKRRLHILLALADAEDEDLRLSAGGVLATLCEFEGTVDAILARERGMEVIAGLCDDENDAIVHRGAVCVGAIAALKGDIGARASARIKELGVSEQLSAFVRSAPDGEAVESAIAALKGLGVQPVVGIEVEGMD